MLRAYWLRQCHVLLCYALFDDISEHSSAEIVAVKTLCIMFSVPDCGGRYLYFPMCCEFDFA